MFLQEKLMKILIEISQKLNLVSQHPVEVSLILREWMGFNLLNGFDLEWRTTLLTLNFQFLISKCMFSKNFTKMSFLFQERSIGDTTYIIDELLLLT